VLTKSPKLNHVLSRCIVRGTNRSAHDRNTMHNRTVSPCGRVSRPGCDMKRCSISPFRGLEGVREMDGMKRCEISPFRGFAGLRERGEGRAARTCSRG